MKRILFLSVSFIFISSISIAQNNIFPLPSGNVGLGTTNPSARLDILTLPGQTESLLRLKISDAPQDYFQITNSTGTPNQFIPLIKGYHESDNRFSLSIMGSSSDVMDTGTNALVNFNARRKNSQVQNRPLFVWTNYDQKKMTLTANGSLGIGTVNPGSRLDVRGGIKASYSASRHVTLFNSGDGNSYLNIAGGTSTSRFGFQVDGSSKMSIMKNGNIGIGIGNPSSKVVVQSNSGETESLAQFKISDAPSDYLQIANSTGAANQFIPLIKGYHETDNRYSLSIMGSSSDAMDNGANALVNFNARRGNSQVQNRPLFVWTNYDQKKMILTANGNLGIGTTTPDSKLAVNGKIHAKEVKIDLTGWPDYVFEDNYELPTLKEVESHIQEKGHLPNIPSAKKVEKEGIQLGEMNAKLLQKIEELTLYIIAQNKKTEQLQKEVALLKQKIK